MTGYTATLPALSALSRSGYRAVAKQANFIASRDDDGASQRIEPDAYPRYTAAVVEVIGDQVEPTSCWADTERVAILISAGLFLRIQQEQVGEGRYNPVFRLDVQRYRLLGLTSTRCH